MRRPAAVRLPFCVARAVNVVVPPSKNGRITRPIKNMRWNESPIFLLNNIEAMGAPVRVSSSESGSAGQAVVVPPVKARDFNFTSLSDAV